MTGLNPETSSSWLVRTSDNVILGPFTKESICALVRERKINALDEVCHANHFWFFLHEDSEVKQQLGISVPVFNPKKPRPDEESTQTDTSPGDDQDTDRFASPDEFPRARRAKVVPVAGSAPVRRQMPVPVEVTSFWRGIIWALAVLVIVLLYTVFRILGTAGAGRLPG